MIKKVIIAVISILLIAGLAAGGYIFYKTTTPEYALYQTVQDIRESGMDGLKAHLTSNAREKADRVTEWSDNAIVSGLSGENDRVIEYYDAAGRKTVEN